MPTLIPFLSATWNRLPLKILWIVVVLSAFIIPWSQREQAKPGEFYPFSNFPMYSTFSSETYYVYVTDLEDQPVAVRPLSGKSLSNIKKIYDQELKRRKDELGGSVKMANLPIEAREESGKIVLAWLAANGPPSEVLEKKGGLRLKQVNIRYDGASIHKETMDVGEWRVR